MVIRPTDGDSRPIWIARALTDPDCNRNHPNCVEIQYYQPSSKSTVIQETYQGWDSTRGLKWKVDETQAPEWLHTNAIISSWKSNTRQESRRATVAIPGRQIEVIRESLVRIATEG